MVYGVHYIIQAQGKNGKLYQCQLLELSYVDAPSYIDASSQPFIHNFLAKSDSPFDPSIASDLVINMDITEFSGDALPDFTSRDDKKYMVKFYADSDLLFLGYILTDSVSLNFSTGRIVLTVTAVDGIGMLQSIPYLQNYTGSTPTIQDGAVMVDINVRETLLQVMLNCLNKLGLPLYLNIACNIYADGMDTSQDVFSQIQYYKRNWQNSDYTWKYCLAIIETIAHSFGCQFFQANGEYWIANTNERGAATIRYFKYYYDGTLTSSGDITIGRSVEPYDTAVDYYFINNEQRKVIRKGYPIIKNISSYSYATNLIDNGNIKRPPTVPGTLGIVAYNWDYYYPLGAGGSVTASNIGPYQFINLVLGSGASLYVQPTSIAPVTASDILTLAFLMGGHDPASSTIPAFLVEIKLVASDGSSTYYCRNYTDSGASVPTYWDPNPQTGRSYYYAYSGTTALYENYSIEMGSIPISGLLQIRFYLKTALTETNGKISNVVLSASSPYLQRVVSGYYDNTSQYKKDNEIEFGYDVGQNVSLLGAMLREPSVSYPDYPRAWTNWYRYGVTEAYADIPRLLVQQFINSYAKAQINIEGSVCGVNLISLLSSFTFVDITYLYPVTDKPYLLGNASIDYIDNSIRGTWLQATSTDITDETITDYVIIKP